jgi:L-alanine-DL-glutamate epimerase-like enolase superfamily enzyme
VIDPIAEVEALTTRLELTQPITLGTMHITHRAYAVVTVRTESGLEGKAFALSRDAPIAAIVSEQLAPILVGRDADLVAARADECFRATVASGRVGLTMRAFSLVDIALWDIKAQRARLPLWRLLGGNAREVPMMVVGGYPTGEPPEELGAKIAEYGRRGWRLVKLARMADPEAMGRLLAAWGEAPVAWLEDPLPTEDVPAYARLRAATRVPLGAGDEITDPHLMRAHLAAGTLDVVRVDATTIGGVSGALRIMRAAADAAVPVSCHVYPELHVHLAAFAADATSIETFDPEDNWIEPSARLYEGGPELRPGVALAPETPGLGIDLDRELIERYRLPG